MKVTFDNKEVEVSQRGDWICSIEIACLPYCAVETERLDEYLLKNVLIKHMHQ